MNKNKNLLAAAFLIPNLLGFFAFTLLPVLFAFGLSFFRWDLFNPAHFAGLQNFIDLLGWHTEDGQRCANDPEFWKYLGNTLFLLLGIPVNMAAALFLAVLLNQKLRGRVLFRTIFYLPSVCAGVGIMLLWLWIYNPEFGPLNRLLFLAGIEGPDWLKSYHWAKPSLMLMGLWTAMGGANMIIFLAGLQRVPPELYEAAQIDGAGAWQRFRHITWPVLTPTTFFIFITSVIAGFQGDFDSVYVMTRGGPDGATTNVSYYIFNHSFQWFNMGYAATIAMVLFALVLALTVLFWRFGQEKGVHYV